MASKILCEYFRLNELEKIDNTNAIQNTLKISSRLLYNATKSIIMPQLKLTSEQIEIILIEENFNFNNLIVCLVVFNRWLVV